MRPPIICHPVPCVVTAAALAIYGCGSHEVKRSVRPVTVGRPGAVPSATTTPAKSRRQANGVIDGQDITTKFGDVQVAVTMRRGRIVDVQWLKLPLDRPRSRSISQQASPILRAEVLSAQSAHIDLLSGATYTSDAWARSVRSALARSR